MRIQTNTSANGALRNLSRNAMASERSIQKLSSGFRINRAGDDAAGLAISNQLRAEGRALGQAGKNAAQGTSMLQVMDGATQTISTILDRMKELSVQANSATIGNQKQKLQDEFAQLRSEIGRIVNTTSYQGSKLVDGSFGAKVTSGTGDFASGALAAAGEIAAINLNGAAAGTITFATATAATMTASKTVNGTTVTQQLSTVAGAQTLNFDQIGVKINTGTSFVTTAAATSGTVVVGGGSAQFQVSSSGSANYGNVTNGDLIQLNAFNLATDSTALNLDTIDLTLAADATNGAQNALTRLDTAISSTNDALGLIGAAQSRFDFASSNVATMLQNTQAAESTIRDADMAYEMTQYTKNNILQQAATSMLSQANQGAQGILELLRG